MLYNTDKNGRVHFGTSKIQGVIILLYCYYYHWNVELTMTLFVLGFILSRHIRFTGSYRRLSKFDFQQETESYFVKL